MEQARCASRIHFVVTPEGLEVKCNSKYCAPEPGVVVLHTFDPTTGELLGTKLYKEPIPCVAGKEKT